MQKNNKNDTTLVSPKMLHYIARTLRDRDIDITKDVVWRAYCPKGKIDIRWRPTFRTMKAMIERALEVSGDEDLGLDVGQHITFGSFGLLIPALLTSKTLVEALSVGLKYQILTGALLSYRRGVTLDGHIFLGLRSRFTDASIHRFLVQLEMSAFVNVAQFLSPIPQPFLKIETSFEPTDIAKQCRRWCSPIVVTRSSNRMLLKSEMLTHRLATKDSYVHAEVCTELDSILIKETAARDLVHKVEAIFMQALPETQTAAHVAAELGLSPRSLRRKLAESNTNYRELINRVRLDRARQRMEEGLLSQTEIALEVGFEDPRSLRRLLKARPSN
ncbi:MAG: AraC family transcriptional regulator ligand-binding domain-containing protein [Gammaproteobacteria bacterium]